MDTVPKLMTAEELEQLVLADKQTELLRGRLVVREPPGMSHGRVAATLSYYLSDFIRREQLGVVFAQDTGFKLESNPDTVRAPDVAFVARGRASQIPERGYAPIVPDLLAEIVSPGDAPAELLAKVADWLGAGVRLIWVIDPAHVQARVYRRDGSLSLIAADGTLSGEDVLPGFSCSLSEALG
ncbi:MAG: Uma2 family endonuclease [Gemmatimonadaceae bacterium]